jgi:replicative DNA helicase Mcm
MAGSPLDGLSGGPKMGNGTLQQEERHDYSSLSVIPISQAARLHEGHVKTRGVISAISPLTKLVESFYYECESCHQAKEIPGIKWADGKPMLFQEIKKSGKCAYCGNEVFRSQCKYVNAIIIELRDLDTYSDIDPLRAVLFEEDTKNVYNHLGEVVIVSGQIHTFPLQNFKRKFSSYLYVESIKYESSQELVITDLDKEAIHRFTRLKGNGIIDSLIKLFARDVIGCEIVKKGLLLLAASTNRDINQKKINAALIGDPGLVKSTLLRRAVRLVPNSKYESAQNSSGKSLTAIVEKEDESHILRIGPIPAAKGAICALNEIGRMHFDDQKHLLDVMQEQFFTINKHGISVRISSPTATIVSANPIDGEWKDPDRIDLDEFPVLKPLVDRIDLIFVFRNKRDEQIIRNYADSKFEFDDTLIPDYTPYLQKHIEYSKRFNPKMSDEAKFMLKEFYVSIAKNHGSPRIRETIVTIAKMVSRLKLKNTIDAEDAKEAMEFYNVILQQLDQIVNVTTDPSDETFECCISVLQESCFAVLFEKVIKSACTKNDRVRHYIGEKFKLRDNKKLRPILGRLRNHSHIRIVNEKPVALKWVSDDNYTSRGHLEDSSNTDLTTTCAPCDQCDPNNLRTEKIEGTISEETGKVEEGTDH